MIAISRQASSHTAAAADVIVGASCGVAIGCDARIVIVVCDLIGSDVGVIVRGVAVAESIDRLAAEGEFEQFAKTFLVLSIEESVQNWIYATI